MTKNGLRRIDQVNNSYIFPGIGLGALVVRASRITNRMFLIAAKELAKFAAPLAKNSDNFLPPLTEVRKIARNIAFAIAKEAVQSGLTNYKELSDEQINHLLDTYIWEPTYLPYKLKED
jgi:malate dehydrogenase (oxaloacetate-decarboxylating)